MPPDPKTSPDATTRSEHLQATIRALSSLLEEPGAVGTDRVTVALLRRLMCQLNLVRLDAAWDGGASRVREPVPAPRRRAYERPLGHPSLSGE